MKVSYFPKQITKEKTILILGKFESFHNGHMKLLKKAKEFNKPIAIMVLANPENLPSHKKEVYQTLDIRLQQFANLNIKYASIIKVDQKLISMEGNVFLDQLIKSVNAQAIVFGKDFTVGKNQTYNFKKIVQEYENAFVVPHFKINGKKISTTLLKELIPIGEVSLIKQLCPFPYTVKVRANNYGNINWNKNMLPHPAIYAIYVIKNKIRYYGLLHITMNKKVFINIPDIKIKNSSYELEIMFIEKVRTIIKSTKDKILDQDEELVLKSLNNI